MKIITISREFGSGGREVGKRLADLLDIDYYDDEIIARVANNESLSKEYVEEVLENRDFMTIPLTFGRSFAAVSFMQQEPTELLVAQRKVIESIANAGKDCIIVGRNADVILEKYEPFKIFVNADIYARVNRCIERAKEGEDTNPKEVRKKILGIDKTRARSREILSDGEWGSPELYDLCVNTTNRNIKQLTKALKEYIHCLYPEIKEK